MKEGDSVEFWSSENGGMWKPAVLAKWISFFHNLELDPELTKYVRLQTGSDVFVIRKKTLVRLRVTNESERNIHLDRC